LTSSGALALDVFFVCPQRILALHFFWHVVKDSGPRGFFAPSSRMLALEVSFCHVIKDSGPGGILCHVIKNSGPGGIFCNAIKGSGPRVFFL
jgi:hypothetical protein